MYAHAPAFQTARRQHAASHSLRHSSINSGASGGGSDLKSGSAISSSVYPGQPFQYSLGRTPYIAIASSKLCRGGRSKYPLGHGNPSGASASWALICGAVASICFGFATALESCVGECDSNVDIQTSTSHCTVKSLEAGTRLFFLEGNLCRGRELNPYVLSNTSS